MKLGLHVRALGRSLPLGLGTLLITLGASRVAHATALIAVNTTADEDGTGTSCSLREAIKSANTDTAYGGCYAGSGDDYIYFETGGQTVTLTKSSILGVKGSVTIEGYDTVINGGSNPGITIDAGSYVSIRALHMTGFTYNTPIIVNGSLTLSKSDIHHNSSASTAQTMGIWVGSTGSLDATDVALRNNSGIKGGGIYNVGGFVSIENSTITNNTSSQYGGGIMTTGPGAFTEIINCTISGNRAQGYWGGGIHNGYNASTEIYNSTIYNNSSKDGGGIWEDSSSPYGYVSIRNTIVSNNTANENPGCRGLVYSYSGNLIGSNTCTMTRISPPTNNAPDQTGVSDVMLGSLAKVGTGIQYAHTPASGSPAVNKITASPNYCYRTYDQVNKTRPRGAKCDVGSIER